MEDKISVESWFQIDAGRFKQGLLNCIKRWSLMFKKYLIDHTSGSLTELSEFVKVTLEDLKEDPKPGDYDHLVSTMSCLGAVKARQASTDEMFEPLKQTTELLTAYGYEVPQEVLHLLEVCI